VAKEKIEMILKKNPDRWRILAYKYGHKEQGPSNFDGHASAIRFNSSNKKIEFVDQDGFLVTHITEDTKQIDWEDFDLGSKKKIYLFIYKDRLIEYTNKIKCV
jgi:hypothetical protein